MRTNIKKALCIFLSIICIMSTMTVFADEEVYDELYLESVCSFDKISEAGKRLTQISKYDTGEKCFAVAGLWSSSKTKFFMLDITNPLNIKKIQDLSDSYSRMILNSGMLYALNTSSNTIDVYKMNEDGYVDLSNKISEAAIGRASNIQEMKVIDARYVFVSQRSADDAIMVFDAANNMNKVISLSSTKPNTDSSTGIQTGTFDVFSVGEGIYRIYSYTRCYYDSKHNYELVITDIDLNNNSFENVYWGVPESDQKISEGNLKKINILNDHTLVLLYPDKNCGVEIVDVSNTEQPVKMADIIDIGRGLSFNKINDNEFIIGSEDGPVCAYIYDENGVRPLSNKINTSAQIYDIERYDGYLIMANNSVINVYSYMSKLNVAENQILPSFESYVRGTVSGYVPGRDTVTVTVNSVEYDAVMEGNAFYAEIEGANYDVQEKAVVSLYRDGNIISTAESTITIEKKNRIKFLNPVHDYSSNGIYTFNSQICNQSTVPIGKCTVYAAVYSDDSMSDYDFQVIDHLSGNTYEDVSLNVQYNPNTDKYIKVFAVDAEKDNTVLSETLLYPTDSQLTDYSKLIKEDLKTDNNVELEYDFNYEQENVIFNMISKQNNDCGVLTVYKSESNLSEESVDFIDVISLNSFGKAALRYSFDDNAVNFDKFNIIFTSGKYTDKALITFVSKELVKAFFEDIKNSTLDTIYSVLTSEEYSKILNIDFNGEYSMLSEAGKLEVLKNICGKEFSSLKSVEDTFNNSVAGVSAAEKMSNEKDIDNVMELIDEYFGRNVLKESIIYQNAMKQSIKKSFVTAKILGKNISSADMLDSILQNDSKLFYLNNLTAGAIVDDKVIETYGEALGIDKKDINSYTSSKYKINIIKEFIKNEFVDCDSIKTRFASALKNADQNTGATSGGKVTGGGGGGGTPILPSVKQEPVDPSKIVESSSVKNNSAELVFIDVNNSAWYSRAINYLVSKGYAEGVTDTSFAPEQNITREEFVKMVISSFRLEDNSAETSFEDTNKNAWHYMYIASANKYHIVNGESDDFFGVGFNITREDMATILSRVFNLKNINLEENEVSEFVDKDTISSYAAENVVKMQRMNVINGFEDGTFRPKEYATRAMAAQMIYNILERMSN